MRALLPLLAAALLAAAADPRALLVLRAACRARDPALFARLAAFHLLPYEQTCGPEWSRDVTRAALSALSEGRAVAAVGWPGAGACEAMSGAAHALRRHLAEPCARSAALGGAVAQLAARLGWRRVLLPPHPPRSECRAALHHVAKSLAAAALHVTQSPQYNDEDSPSNSYVVILCASRGWSASAGAEAARAAAAVLLLHVDEPALTATTHDTHDAFHLSNIDSLVNKFKIRDKKESPSSGSLIPRNFSSFKRFVRAVHLPASIISNETEQFSVSVDLIETSNSFYGVIHKKSNNESKNRPEEENIKKPRKRTRRNSETIRPDYILGMIDKSLPRGKLLLLSEDRLDEGRQSYDFEQVYREAVEMVERTTTAEILRIQKADILFYLYGRSGGEKAKWSRVANLNATCTRLLDESRDWHVGVSVYNASRALDAWNESESESEEAGAGWNGGTAGAGACLALGAAGGAALAGRWAAARRRRARRCGDVVLSPQHFTFPADERRCVGDGMETMLSCWLQQLHEFGGPELERPDLLKQPPCAHAPPRPPSAPSSTCSVNRIALDRRTRYKGDAVHLKYLQTSGPLELKRKAIDVLIVMQCLRHENLNPFIGCLCEARPALVFDECGRGSLEDVLMADEIKLDWTFRLSLLTDLVKGMRYLHASPLRVHGRLSSRNCVVDSRWVLRLTDYGLPAFHRAQPLPLPHRSARELLWTAPELLRDEASGWRGSQAGDVFSFAIIMQEVIVRGEPYCMLALSPEEIVEKVSRPPPLIRPSVSMGAAPPEAVSVMRQCWSEAPDLRPDFHRLHDIFRHLNRGRKINIVDSMFEMLEKYSNNLEELIKERTEQLDMEKKKTEQLLNRMLPRSVAERLLMGSRVEPEEFEEVSIYFSDIVGFTGLAARSTPVQVVDLLNDLYTTFDAAIEQYRVYKVETIGDAYMVVGGLPTRTRDHAESVATMALHLLHLAGRFRIRHLPDTPLHLRIGLHTGPCCAAVVGLTMPRYCLFGDTVNTASRMESTGAAWRVQVSAATADRLLLAGGYRLRSRGLTMIKGKGAMHTYWLLGKDGFDKPLPAPPPLPSEEVLFESEGENDSECSPSGTAAARTPFEGGEGEGGAHPLQAGWQRSGAVSADSSPPRGVGGAGGAGAAREARGMVSAASVDRGGPYSRYRWLGGGGAAGGARVLRRQWSLERGEALATAAASLPALAPPEPLVLLSAPPRSALPPRYRTRPEPQDDAPRPPLSAT